jgi:rubredoxin
MAENVRYKCTGCAWIYDPRFGDAANEVPRGIPFEKLPAKFICGVCGCAKEKFEKMEEGPKKEAPKKKK